MADVPCSPRGGGLGDLFLDPLIGELCEAIAEDGFQREFEGFFRAHCARFAPGEGDEHALECTGLYAEFQALFDRRLESFTGARGLTPAAFVSRVRAAQESDAHAEKYLAILLASTDYEQFAALMRRMRESEARAGRARPYLVADAKGSRGDDDDDDDDEKHAKRGAGAGDWVEMEKLAPSEDDPRSDDRDDAAPAKGEPPPRRDYPK